MRVRTLNCIHRALNAKALESSEPVTVAQLLRLKSFGLVSLLDVMCVIEAGLDSGFLRKPEDPPTCSQHWSNLPEASISPISDPPDPLAAAWDPAVVVLRRLLAATAELNSTQSLAEALGSNLGQLASELGMTQHLEDIEISELTGSPVLAHEALAALTEFWESLKPLEQSILEKRLLAAEPLTLEELGMKAGLTRERIRQIEKSVESRLNHPSITGPAINCWMGILAKFVGQELGPITDQDDLEKRIAATFPVQNNSEDDNPTIANMARHLLQKELGYSCADGLCLGPEARTAISDLKERARWLADDIGLLNETELQDCLPDETWRQHWEALLERSGLHRLSNHLALRDTQKARAKAALLSIGRPATKEEIGELCRLRPDRAGAQLSLLPGVVRADKHRWGLAEWVDDEYEGIPAEIIQRINEDGGATRLNRLLEELPRLFGVSENSVRTYVNTPKFLLEDGYVSLAGNNAIALRSLEDVIHGRTPEGQPYWRFKVEGRFFDGYSLVGLPPEIAKVLGCDPDGRMRVPVLFPENCGPVSVNWPLSSPAGASLGYLSAPLNLLGTQEGEQVLLVLETSNKVSLHHDGPQLQHSRRTAEADGSNNSHDRAKDLLERMKNRRRGL